MLQLTTVPRKIRSLSLEDKMSISFKVKRHLIDILAKTSKVARIVNYLHIYKSNHKVYTKMNLLSGNLKDIYLKSVSAVQPDSMIRNNVELRCTSGKCTLLVCGNEIPINGRKVRILGFGKAVLAMAVELEKILGKRLAGGILSVPVGTKDKFADNNNMQIKNEFILIIEGAENNLPDRRSELAGQKIWAYAKACDKEDLLIVLISGGGSALLPSPVENVSLEDKSELIKKLADQGAGIKELNTVRKKLSCLKGGRLADVAKPTQVVALVLSDIIGDPLDLIASGPTVQDTDDPMAAARIIDKYNLKKELTSEINKYIYNMKPNPPPDVTNAQTFIIGNNKIAIEAASREATAKGYTAIVMSSEMQGDLNEMSATYAELTLATISFVRGDTSEQQFEQVLLDFGEKFKLSISNSDVVKALIPKKSEPGICYIFGGEPTIEVTGEGVGGRNQQMALQFSEDCFKHSAHLKDYFVVFLSAGTDGIDGPTDAAGAIGFPELIAAAEEEELNVRDFLDNNDSNTFYRRFQNGRYSIVTGHSGTNVMDIHCLLIKREIPAPRTV